MTGGMIAGQTDFEPAADDLALSTEDAEPIVSRPAGDRGPVLVVAGFSIAALALFLALNGQRVARREAAVAPAAAPSQSRVETEPPRLEMAPILASAPASGPFSGLPPTVGNLPPPAAPLPLPAPALGAPRANSPETAARIHAPAVVVDFGGASRDLVLAQSGPPAGGPATALTAGAAPATARAPLSDSEQFAKRVGEEEPERARATPMRSLRTMAPQGTIIAGVLETAINSDLPGFTRALVSRDVLSFDGKAVLIPRGSRLIGQYKSAVALGQSRAFIIWTRVIRPDGVSILIGSPGTDELGRGGLDGQVDRHFFRRFSGSILLSVLNAAVASVGRTPSTQISIGSPGAATGLASSAIQGDAIPPTIKVAQGQAINIFVARDLDFSDVEPIR